MDSEGDNDDSVTDQQEQRGEDDESDSSPAFIDADDAVEVEVNDDDVSMGDDDSTEAVTERDGDDGEEPVGSTHDSDVPDMATTTISSHSSSVYAVAVSVDSARVVSILTGGGDDRAFLHKLENGSVTSIPLLHPHADSVSSVAFNTPFLSPDLARTPHYAAVGSYDGTIVLYDPSTGDKLKVLDGPTDVEFIAFHPNGGSVLLAGSISDATVWMYHLPTFKCMQVFVGHASGGENGGVTHGAFPLHGKFAVTTGMDGTMRIWAPRTGACRHVFHLTDQNGGGGGLTCLAVNGGTDEQLAIGGGENGNAYVCHLLGKKVVATLRHFDLFSNNSSSTRTTNNNTMDADGGKMQEEEQMRSVEAVAFAPRIVNPQWVATGGVDGSLKVWDLNNDGQCRQTCRPPPEGRVSGITRLAWHPTLPIIFASYADGVVRLWNARDGAMLRVLTGGTANDQINDLAIHVITAENNGGIALVVTGNDDGSVKVFEVDVAGMIASF